jgi:hypothetical protein
MRSVAVVAVVAAAAVLAAACGAPHHDVATAAQPAFDCRGRVLGYVATHTMAAAETGVEMDCASGPRIKRWQVDTGTSNRHESARSMTPAEFDKVWNDIAGTGWENLKDCKNGDGGKDAPVYQFAIKDDQNTARFACQSLRMPYPYNDLVDPLDAAAAQGMPE